MTYGRMILWPVLAFLVIGCSSSTTVPETKTEAATSTTGIIEVAAATPNHPVPPVSAPAPGPTIEPTAAPATAEPQATRSPTSTPVPTPTATPSPTLPIAARPIGTIEEVTEEQCLGSYGEECRRAAVACPGIASAVARIRVTGAGEAGTILLPTGSRGTAWYRVGEENPQGIDGIVVALTETLLGDGFKLVEVAWDEPGVWEGPGGSITLACRSATVFRWLEQNVHSSGPLIAQGNSGGNAQIALSLAYYGLDEILDLANLSGGPPPCPLSLDGVLNRGAGGDCLPWKEGWDGSGEPILSDQPRVHYPGTKVRFFLGENEPTWYIGETAQAYYEAITSEKSLQIVPNTAHGVHRTQHGAEALISAVREVAGLPVSGD